MDKEDAMNLVAVLERIAVALEALPKAITEAHYDTNDGAIRVSLTK